jgi:integrase
VSRAAVACQAAVGALTSFLLGLRASEVTDRVVRDLYDNGRLLWIELGKTKRSRRTLEVLALLRPYLLALAKDRPADAQLISRRSPSALARSGSALAALSCGAAVCGGRSADGVHAVAAEPSRVSRHRFRSNIARGCVGTLSQLVGCHARALLRWRDGAA